MSTPTTVDFALTYFNSSIQLTQLGTIEELAPPAIDASATAIIEVNASDMQSVFKFQTDDFNVNDISSNDMRYYVYTSSWPVKNPANSSLLATGAENPIATLSSNGTMYTEANMKLKHDFVRYLALKLFNTAYGVDLFNNVDDLLANIEDLCGSNNGAVWDVITDKLNELSTTDGTPAYKVFDSSNNVWCCDNTSLVNSDYEMNVCRILLEQIASVAPERFASVSGSVTPQSLPFIAGDTISFKLTVAAATNQHDLTGVSPIPDRSYKIKLVMV